MLSGELYQPIYLLVVTLLTLPLLHHYYATRNNTVELASAGKFPVAAAVLTIAVIIFIGFRPYYSGFTDMYNYNEMFYHEKNMRQIFEWTWNTANIIYDNFFVWCAINFNTTTPFYVIMAAIYFSGIFLACRLIFPGNTLASLLTYLAAFSTFSYGVNGVKAGAAASIFLVALSCHKKRWLLLLLALVSLGFHHSMQLCVAALIVTMLYRNPRFYLFLWVACFFVALLRITAFQDFFATVTDDSGSSYLGQVVEDETKGLGGFRIDFILYSFAPIAMGIYAIFVKEFKSGFYEFLLSLYLITNSIWLLCIYANFTNRIAYLSWFMLPIVLIYPVLHPGWGQNRFKNFSIIMLAHLSFTLFMQFVYYA